MYDRCHGRYNDAGWRKRLPGPSSVDKRRHSRNSNQWLHCVEPVDYITKMHESEIEEGTVICTQTDPEAAGSRVSVLHD